MSDTPFVSIIMPIRNEADFIARSLGAALAQAYPPACLEVLVVDGLSTDGTREAVARIIGEHPDQSIILLDNPSRVVPAAMNIGLRRARGDVIVRVDGHCEIAPDYVARCVAHLREQAVDGVGGPIETVGATPLSQTIAVAMSSVFGVGDSAFRTTKDRASLVDTIPFPAYTRETLEKGGPYDETLVRNQDDEYNYRLRKLGLKLLLAPDVRSTYYSRSSLRSLWRQYFAYGFYKVRVLQKHPRQMRARQFAPPLLAASLLLGAAVAPFSRVARRLWLLAAGLYALANLAASLVVAARRGWRHAPLLPAVFAVLHLSYGLGFLVGLARFAGHWRGLRRS